MISVKTEYTRKLSDGNVEVTEVTQHFVSDEHQLEYYAEMKKRGWEPKQLEKVKNLEIQGE